MLRDNPPVEQLLRLLRNHDQRHTVVQPFLHAVDAAVRDEYIGAFQHGKARKFWFQLDAELIVYGATESNAKVTLQGEPVKLRPDGTFTMRFSLPDSRQIIPATAASADGIEERTIVLAVERNTKQLEPLMHEMNE